MEYILTRNRALEMMRSGKVIGFLGIPGVEMFMNNGMFLFKHRDGHVELLDDRTMEGFDGYYVIREFQTKKAIFNKQRRLYELK